MAELGFDSTAASCVPPLTLLRRRTRAEDGGEVASLRRLRRRLFSDREFLGGVTPALAGYFATLERKLDSRGLLVPRAVLSLPQPGLCQGSTPRRSFWQCLARSRPGLVLLWPCGPRRPLSPARVSNILGTGRHAGRRAIRAPACRTRSLFPADAVARGCPGSCRLEPRGESRYEVDQSSRGPRKWVHRQLNEGGLKKKI